MITMRNYQWPEDFEKVGDFIKNNLGGRYKSTNWTQARWEYMHYHPYMDYNQLYFISIWEDADQIVAVIHFELALGDVYLEVKEGYEHLKKAMIEYAEAHLSIDKKSGGQRLRVYVNDFDEELKALLTKRGYCMKHPVAEAESTFDIPESMDDAILPDGYTLKGLDEENDLVKLDRLIWRGFNHEGEPPEDNIDGRKQMQSSPNYDMSLNIVVHGPEGQYCSYAGIWYDDVNKLGYVEPVCTDPDYRRMGLGRAAVLEGIRRCAKRGATIAKVGSRQPFYLALGFKEVYSRQLWSKCFAK